jgi:hypothetical protein
MVGQPGEDREARQNMAAHYSKDHTAEDRIVGKGQQGQESRDTTTRDRAVRTRNRRQDGQNVTIRIGQLGKDNGDQSRDKTAETAGTGQSGQDCQ